MRMLTALLITTTSILVGCGSKNLGKEFTTESVDNNNTEASQTTSSISVTSQVVADSLARAVIAVVIRNSDNKPLSGQSLEVSVTGSGNTLSKCGVSNQDGFSLCYLSSSIAETKKVTVTIGKFSLTSSSVFTIPTQFKMIAGITSGGNVQVAPSGQRLITFVGQTLSQNNVYDSNGNLRLKANLQGHLWKK